MSPAFTAAPRSWISAFCALLFPNAALALCFRNVLEAEREGKCQLQGTSLVGPPKWQYVLYYFSWFLGPANGFVSEDEVHENE